MYDAIILSFCLFLYMYLSMCLAYVSVRLSFHWRTVAEQPTNTFLDRLYV